MAHNFHHFRNASHVAFYLYSGSGLQQPKKLPFLAPISLDASQDQNRVDRPTRAASLQNISSLRPELRSVSLESSLEVTSLLVSQGFLYVRRLEA